MKIVCQLSALLIMLLFVCAASSQETRPRIFTNEDLINNKSSDNRDSSGNKIPKKSSAKKSPGGQKKSGGKEKEKWCRKGRLYQNRVDDARRNLEYAESKQKETESNRRVIKKSGKKTSSSDANIRKARLKLEKAERALNDLEQEAHRNNIPPGWLRCQFSY